MFDAFFKDSRDSLEKAKSVQKKSDNCLKIQTI